MATWQHLRSSTANKRPTTSLADGRIAINTNTASPGLFFKDSAGTGIVKVGPVHVGTTAPNSVPAAGGSSGNYLGEQWLDTSVSPAQMKVWNGSTWVGIVADELPVSKLQDGAPRQLIQTDAAGTGVEWTSDVDVPGTLDVTSTATFDSIAQHPLGSAGAPTITFTGDTNTGIYSPGADQVAVATNGTGRLFVDASGNLNVKKTAAGLSSVGFTAYDTGRVDVTANSATPFFINRLTSNGELISFYKDTVSQGGIKVSGSDFEYAAYNAGALLFSTNSTERLRITSAGLVGVGTSAPNLAFHVSSGTAAGINNVAIFKGGGSSSGNGAGVVLSPDSANTYNTWLGSRVATAFGGASWGCDLILSTNNNSAADNLTERMRITSAGLVGIGTPSPLTKFVASNGGAEGIELAPAYSAGNNFTFHINRSGSAYVTNSQVASAHIFRISSDSTEAARIDTSGRLLVGTSSVSGSSGTAPYAKIQVQGNAFSSTTQGAIAIKHGSAPASIGANSTVGSIAFAANNDGEYAWIDCVADGTGGTNDYPGRLVFSTTADGASSPTERMRITSGGSVLIAKTAEDTANVGVQINTGGTLAVTSATTQIDCRRNSTDGRSIGFYRDGTDVGNISVTTTATAYNTSSDYRLKDNVTAVTDGITRLQQLKPSRFNFIADPTKTVDGFIAHEVQAVVPEAITGEKDAVNDDGNPVYQGIDQSKLVPLLTAALQEAVAKIESLEARLTAAGI